MKRETHQSWSSSVAADIGHAECRQGALLPDSCAGDLDWRSRDQGLWQWLRSFDLPPASGCSAQWSKLQSWPNERSQFRIPKHVHPTLKGTTSYVNMCRQDTACFGSRSPAHHQREPTARTLSASSPRRTTCHSAWLVWSTSYHTTPVHHTTDIHKTHSQKMWRTFGIQAWLRTTWHGFKFSQNTDGLELGYVRIHASKRWPLKGPAGQADTENVDCTY